MGIITDEHDRVISNTIQYSPLQSDFLVYEENYDEDLINKRKSQWKKTLNR